MRGSEGVLHPNCPIEEHGQPPKRKVGVKGAAAEKTPASDGVDYSTGTPGFPPAPLMSHMENRVSHTGYFTAEGRRSPERNSNILKGRHETWARIRT